GLERADRRGPEPREADPSGGRAAVPRPGAREVRTSRRRPRLGGRGRPGRSPLGSHGRPGRSPRGESIRDRSACVETMLRELHISDLGVIRDLDLALGARASATLVRAGAKAARVQARFQAPPGAPWDEWAEEGELVLARSVEADGRSSARVGGQVAPASTLVELATGLVE